MHPGQAPGTDGTPPRDRDRTPAGTASLRATHDQSRETCLFVLDTNVLMHDPTALFRFQEHDIYLPMVVLEELDAAKRGTSDIARNVREVSRLLEEAIHGADEAAIERGFPLPDPTGDASSGRLFFQTRMYSDLLPDALPGSKPDNGILNVAKALEREHSGHAVVIVSRDINLRIKARALGLHAEDYRDDVVLDDVSLLYPGVYEIPGSDWEARLASASSWHEHTRTFYAVEESEASGWFPNQCLHPGGPDGVGLVVRRIEDHRAVIEPARDYRAGHDTVWGIAARNIEQNFALNLLMDPDIDFVTLIGTAGTGKTLLALAAGLAQTLDEKRYREIVMTRVTVSVGDDIGFLPGTEEEKMTPWMGALMDNLEVLTDLESGGGWERAATNDLLRSRIKVRSLNFMRGRTFLNRYVILDEAQNLTRHQMKTLITRAGPGTKMVCLGNVRQIDTPWLSETTSGLTHVVDRFKHWRHSGHVTLVRGERSRLADFATESL